MCMRLYGPQGQLTRGGEEKYITNLMKENLP